MNHGTCPEGMECACCYDDIEGGNGGNYVEYRTGEGSAWRPSLFCKECIKILIKRQWPIYEEALANATCKAQQKRMLGEGPPTHVKDKKALACEEGENVHSLWFVGDDGGEPQIQSALLEGAPQGEARQIWWDEKLAFQFDEDDDEAEEVGGEGEKAAETAGSAASAPPPVPGTPPPAFGLPSPPAASAATTTASQGDGVAVAGAASTTHPTPTTALETAGTAVVGAVGVQAGVAPAEVVVEEGASTSATAAAPGAASTAVPMTDAAPTAPAVPLA